MGEWASMFTGYHRMFSELESEGKGQDQRFMHGDLAFARGSVGKDRSIVLMRVRGHQMHCHHLVLCGRHAFSAEF